MISDLEQNILKYEKFGDDDSGGDDSDYSNENKKYIHISTLVPQ